MTTDTLNRTRPSTTRPAIATMRIGLVLTLVAVLAVIIDQATADSVAQHLREAFPGYRPDQLNSERSGILTYLFAVGALATAAWLWMIWAVRAAKRWARLAMTVLFGLSSGIALINFTLSSGGVKTVPTVLALFGALPCLAALAAVILLWTRGRQPSTEV